MPLCSQGSLQNLEDGMNAVFKTGVGGGTEGREETHPPYLFHRRVSDKNGTGSQVQEPGILTSGVALLPHGSKRTESRFPSSLSDFVFNQSLQSLNPKFVEICPSILIPNAWHSTSHKIYAQ